MYVVGFVTSSVGAGEWAGRSSRPVGLPIMQCICFTAQLWKRCGHRHNRTTFSLTWHFSWHHVFHPHRGDELANARFISFSYRWFWRFKSSGMLHRVWFLRNQRQTANIGKHQSRRRNVPENPNLRIIRFSSSLSCIILHLRVSCIYRRCIVTGVTFRKDCHVEN